MALAKVATRLESFKDILYIFLLTNENSMISLVYSTMHIKNIMNFFQILHLKSLGMMALYLKKKAHVVVNTDLIIYIKRDDNESFIIPQWINIRICMTSF
jgi:hypothetical protein